MVTTTLPGAVVPVGAVVGVAGEVVVLPSVSTVVPVPVVVVVAGPVVVVVPGPVVVVVPGPVVVVVEVGDVTVEPGVVSGVGSRSRRPGPGGWWRAAAPPRASLRGRHPPARRRDGRALRPLRARRSSAGRSPPSPPPRGQYARTLRA
ncbi:MAG: hypothetical protein M5T61_05705 [Acidimicrobiia bacterium]|nr:hypothetical protein [Acidimicrobiia bacterium]